MNLLAKNYRYADRIEENIQNSEKSQVFLNKKAFLYKKKKYLFLCCVKNWLVSPPPMLGIWRWV